MDGYQTFNYTSELVNVWFDYVDISYQQKDLLTNIHKFVYTYNPISINVVIIAYFYTFHRVMYFTFDTSLI